MRIFQAPIAEDYEDNVQRRMGSTPKTTLHDVRKESRKLDKQIEGLLDRIVTTKSESVISVYEKRIEKLELGKMVMSEKLENKPKPVHSFTETFELSLKFIANP